LDSSAWESIAREYRDRNVLLIDEDHDFPESSFYSPYLTHRAMGLFLAGHVRVKVKRGDQFQQSFWRE
jgi:hypothetical protein